MWGYRIFVLALVAGCSGFQPVAGQDGAVDDAGMPIDGALPGGDFGPPNGSCRMMPLDCLDPSPANVIEAIHAASTG